jgi:hypothetical protein
LACGRNGQSPGEESRPAAVAAQAIEAQPSFGQIKPAEAAWSRARQQSKEKGGGDHGRYKTRAFQACKKQLSRGEGRLLHRSPQGNQDFALTAGVSARTVRVYRTAPYLDNDPKQSADIQAMEERTLIMPPNGATVLGSGGAMAATKLNGQLRRRTFVTP